MVSLEEVVASNSQIATKLPQGSVAVFAGATTGIGEITLKTFVRYAVQPRIYLLARNPASAARVIAECRQINSRGEYDFVKVDLSLIKETDAACAYVTSKENLINIVVLSAGEIKFGKTSEGLNNFLAASTYSRIRVVQNLLPVLSTAGDTTPLARVVNVAGGTHEGDIHTSDIDADDIPFRKLRAHMTSVHAFALESLAEQAPNVSFVHDYPGTVYTDLHKGSGGGFLGLVMRILLELAHFFLARWLFVPIEEAGERHVYLATSGRYRPQTGKASGIDTQDSVALSGSNGGPGSGVYSVGRDCEGPAERAVGVLREMRRNGVKELVWDHVTGKIERINGDSGTVRA
ncbi:hypothetical protein EK21DRAFT_70762 [Setomelanomma holmii]|uniref:NAD(P)-binding protein n=1 Tax=Setomelanomma holmii TaxID=210430 RepID=A0A9P4H687_9PLEO|nr:hypothetical protein EK21DRAFT_70762 [Setomelanomma holmii]